MKINRFDFCLVVILLLLGANACDDGKPSNEAVCSENSCQDDESCNVQTGKCEKNKVDVDLCIDKKCAEDEVCNSQTGLCDKLPPEHECETSDDCLEHKICRDNHCVFECENNDACEEGLICKDNRCTTCMAHVDCEGNLICNEGKCETECSADDDCNGSLVCRNQQCKPQCEVDVDCTDGLKCLDNECLECLQDVDCEGGLFCNKKSCVECFEDSQCSGNAFCINDECQFECIADGALDEVCLSDMPYCSDNLCVVCLNDAHCDTNYHCEQNVCIPECNENSDCILGSSGEEGEESEVTNRICSLHKCVECVQNTDCELNYACMNNVCEVCTEADADCDGVLNADDVCPYNAKYTKETGVDCNFVEEDGKKIFELYDASELTRIRELLSDRTGNETFAVRLMRNLNVYDSIDKDNIKDVEFEKTSLSWYERKENDEGEMQYVFHDASADDGYEIKDASCVAQWEPFNLKYVEFDGNGYSIEFKDKQDKTCSLVGSLFGAIEQSSVKNVSLRFNVRGMANAFFAQSIKNSTIESVFIAGNANLEKRPAADEKDLSTYINDDGMSDEALPLWNFGVMVPPNAVNTRNVFRDILFSGNLVMERPEYLSSEPQNSIVFGGLFGLLDHCEVENAQLTVSEHFLVDSRAVVGCAYDIINHSEVSNIRINTPSIVMKNSPSYAGISNRINQSDLAGEIIVRVDNAVYFESQNSENSIGISGISNVISNSSIENLKIHSSFIGRNQSNFYGIVHNSMDVEYSGNVSLEFPMLDLPYFNVSLLTGYATNIDFKQHFTICVDMLNAKEYYGLYHFGVDDGTFRLNGFDIFIDNAHIDDSYFGVSNSNIIETMNGMCHIKISHLNVKNRYFGVSEQIFYPIDNLNIEIENLKTDEYFGISQDVSVDVSNINVKIGELMANKFYGLADKCSCNLKQISFTSTAITASEAFYGVVNDMQNCTVSDVEITNEKTNLYLSKDNYIVTDSYGQDSLVHQLKIISNDISSKNNIYIVKNLKGTLSNSGFFLHPSSVYGFVPFDEISTLARVENLSLYADVFIPNFVYGEHYEMPSEYVDKVSLNYQITGYIGNVHFPVISKKSSDTTLASAISQASDYFKDAIYNDEWVTLLSDYYRAIREIIPNDPDTRKFGAFNHINVAPDQCSELKFINTFTWMHFNHFEQSVEQYLKSEDSHQLVFGEVKEGFSDSNVLNGFSGNSECALRPIENSSLFLTDVKFYNCYWVKNDTSDSAYPKDLVIEYYNPDDYVRAFYGVKPVAAEYVIDARGSGKIDPVDTLSRCADVNSTDCQSPWTLKSFVAPSGLPVSIPWIK